MIKFTLEEISSVLPSDWEAKIKKYNEAINSLILLLNNTKIVNLKKGFIQTDNSIDDGRTESLLIYNIYETARPEYEKKIKALGLKDAQSYINKFTQIDKKHSHDAEWLSTKIKEMIQEYKKAMDAKNKMDTINNNKS
ncbi:hypothetical protein [Mycoplasmopsis cynos]|uniref:hypothetical protein n=1 Tax=Mycoplasmopsis cynos TaxID=171284 RepID=UPI002202712F|nr:hypothetical protein [Mycoplasmopsis cynos]UWV82377.1 hypothetical protein NW067_05285 [Mycoplasmopsis cynos]